MANARGGDHAREDQALYFGDRQLIKDVTDQEIRRGFVQKVYGILGSQLLVTAGIAAPLAAYLTTDRLRQAYVPLIVLASIGTLCTACSLLCCKNVMRRYPSNYAVLFAFTLCEGVLVGYVSSFYSWQSVALSAGICSAIFLGMTLIACTTKTDFTGLGIYLYAMLLSMSAVGLIIWMVRLCGASVKYMVVLYDGMGVMLFTVYVLFDTQLILGCWGGHHRAFEFGIDDYCFAALSLYLDIINLFLYVLRLVGRRRDE